MSVKKSTSRYRSSGKPLSDPYSPSLYLHGHVGGTATWECCTDSYPKFQLIFNASNPFNAVKKAAFSGGVKKPVVLVLKNPGVFEYLIKHIHSDGSHKVVGPYCINVAPPTFFKIPPRKCPPEC